MLRLINIYYKDIITIERSEVDEYARKNHLIVVRRWADEEEDKDKYKNCRYAFDDKYEYIYKQIINNEITVFRGVPTERQYTFLSEAFDDLITALNAALRRGETVAYIPSAIDHVDLQYPTAFADTINQYIYPHLQNATIVLPPGAYGETMVAFAPDGKLF